MKFILGRTTHWHLQKSDYERCVSNGGKREVHSFKMSESLVKHKTDSFEVNPGIHLISTGFCTGHLTKTCHI